MILANKKNNNIFKKHKRKCFHIVGSWKGDGGGVSDIVYLPFQDSKIPENQAITPKTELK